MNAPGKAVGADQPTRHRFSFTEQRLTNIAAWSRGIEQQQSYIDLSEAERENIPDLTPSPGQMFTLE